MNEAHGEAVTPELAATETALYIKRSSLLAFLAIRLSTDRVLQYTRYASSFCAIRSGRTVTWSLSKAWLNFDAKSKRLPKAALNDRAAASS